MILLTDTRLLHTLAVALTVLFVFAWAPPSDFFADEFNGTPGANLAGRVSDSGAVWLDHPSSNYPATLCLSDAGRVRQAVDGAALLYADVVPPSPDYTVRGEFHCFSLTTGRNLAISGRVSPTADQQIFTRYNPDNSLLQLYESYTIKGTAIVSVQPGDDFTIELDLVGSTAGVRFNGTSVIAPVGISLTQAGRVGIRGIHTATNTTGIHLSRLTANSDTVPPPPPVKPPFKLLMIGDSWVGYVPVGGKSIADNLQHSTIEAFKPDIEATVAAQGQGGATSWDWRPGGPYLGPAKAACPPATYPNVLIFLGINDATANGGFVAWQTFQTRLSNIVNDLLASGYTTVYLTYPPYLRPGTGSQPGNVTAATPILLQEYQQAIDGLAGGNIRVANRTLYGFYQDHIDTHMEFPLTHPNAEGALTVAGLLAAGL